MKKYMRTPIIAAITLFAGFGLSTSFAGEIREKPVAVLELFTSQGCSSCPPADKILSQYEGRDDIIALAYHVDYWDYIGWKDTFGSEAFSDYQRAYASAQGKSRIYTPQLMVNGQTDVVGSRSGEVARAVGAARLAVPIDLSADDSMLNVNIGPFEGASEAIVWLVTFNKRAEVKIERGENRGSVLPYTQIVTSRQALGMWSPKDGAHIKLPLHEVLENHKSDGAAIIVQEHRNDLPGVILGAAAYAS